MIEKSIFLEGIDPIAFLGANGSVFEAIRTFFPALKIISRGNEMKVMESASGVAEFEAKLEMLIRSFQRYNRISPAEVHRLIHDFDAGKDEAPEMQSEEEGVIVFGNHGRAIRARTVNQQRLVEKFHKKDLLFAIGPAGTGKTYTAIALAVMSLKNKSVKRIILTRPAVEAGEHLGFLPGDMKEKLDPYLQPLYDALHDMIPPKKLEQLMEEGTVQIAPLAYMRGRTLDNAFVILDEAQNATIPQLKMFLTRMGKNAKFIVTGDVTQVDLPDPAKSGLTTTLGLLEKVKELDIVQFDDRDIIRHKLVKHIVDAFKKLDEAPEKQETGKKKTKP